jgi:hypothetical protein
MTWQIIVHFYPHIIYTFFKISVLQNWDLISDVGHIL